MTLLEQITFEMQQAMKAHDTVRRDTLRLVLAAAKNLEKEIGHVPDDAETLSVIQREAKRHRESIEEFRRGGRQDLVDQEQAELVILETYLPQLMDRAEIEEAARRHRAAGAQDKAQMGLVMRDLMAELKGRADGRLVNQVVQELLS
ncbi:MAG: GatB/YqeY domain-containing protein [Anaerolineae bacterium]|nr:MAG: GatB/YqeY domain-containing protein [Anaerolineae bacterium]